MGMVYISRKSSKRKTLPRFVNVAYSRQVLIGQSGLQQMLLLNIVNVSYKSVSGLVCPYCCKEDPSVLIICRCINSHAKSLPMEINHAY